MMMLHSTTPKFHIHSPFSAPSTCSTPNLVNNMPLWIESPFPQPKLPCVRYYKEQ